METNLINTIRVLNVPKVILRYIMMNFLELTTIKKLLLTVKEMNILDNHSKDLLEKANNGFEWCCKNGHLTVAKWLYSLNEGIDRIDLHANNDYAFRYTCENGHLTVAKWLYSIGGVNIHADDEYAFNWSCANGHLNVAQWLYSIGGVDIHAKRDRAFLWSCITRRIVVAKWLYSLGRINISVDSDAFRYANREVLEWLNSLQ